jgi:phosphoglycolate phosphatase
MDCARKPGPVPTCDGPRRSAAEVPQIEWVHGERLGGRRRCAVFDFDGTLSLLRGHWQGIMVPMMVQTLAAADPSASREELTEVVEQFVAALTGQPTMHQILALVEEVRRRGGQPPDPQQYLADYLAELTERTQRRLAALARGQCWPDEFLVPGARALLQALADRGWLLAVASGTEQEDVRREAAALGIDHFFGPRLWGPVGGDPAFSKQQAIERLLQEHGLQAGEAAVVGDGPAEMRAGRALGMLTVGVASDEQHPDGRIHPRKRAHLVAAGADVIVPDFRQLDAIVALLEGNLVAAGAPLPGAGACE